MLLLLGVLGYIASPDEGTTHAYCIIFFTEMDAPL
jgi:hypothetical protein